MPCSCSTMCYTLEKLRSTARLFEGTPDVVAEVMGKAGRFARRVWSRLNQVGDERVTRWGRHGQRSDPDGVKGGLPALFVDGGWIGVCTQLPPRRMAGLGPTGRDLAAHQRVSWSATSGLAMYPPTRTTGAIADLVVNGSPRAEGALRFRRAGDSANVTGTMNLPRPIAGPISG